MTRVKDREQTAAQLPTFEKFCEQVARTLVDILNGVTPKDRRQLQKLQAIYRVRKEMRPQDRRLIVSALRDCAKRAEDWADKLES
jgi:hypothetical protein